MCVVKRLSSLALATAFVTTTLAGIASPANAAVVRVSSRTLLSQLTVAGEHNTGYTRSRFQTWIDADHDGCNTRYEVLITEAVRKPHVGASCRLTGGKWFSKYDGVTTTDPSTFDIDHLVPLAEAWASGAYRWNADTRKRYANDLGYAPDLIAVSAHSNRSKGEKEPQAYLPPRKSYDCTYMANWVAVKWRWHLKVNSAEKVFLTSHLSTCGWPSVVKPGRPRIGTASTSTTTSGSTGTSGSSSGTDPRFGTCTEAKSYGYGPYYRGVDEEYYWYIDRDGDGIVCE